MLLEIGAGTVRPDRSLQKSEEWTGVQCGTPCPALWPMSLPSRLQRAMLGPPVALWQSLIPVETLVALKLPWALGCAYQARSWGHGVGGGASQKPAGHLLLIQGHLLSTCSTWVLPVDSSGNTEGLQSIHFKSTSPEGRGEPREAGRALCGPV